MENLITLPFEIPALGQIFIVVLLTYAIIEVFKYTFLKSEEQMKLIPTMCIFIGAALGTVIYVLSPEAMSDSKNLIEAMTIGAVSGLASTGANQFLHRTIDFKNGRSDSDSKE